MSRRLFALVIALVVAMAGAACASSSGIQRTDSNVLTQQELQDSGVSNLYDAVFRLRPRWLQIRGARSINSSVQIVVFMDRAYMGEPEVLRSYDVKSALRLRYLDGATASATLRGFDSRHVEGAIVIETVERR